MWSPRKSSGMPCRAQAQVLNGCVRAGIGSWVILQVLGHVTQEQQTRFLHSSWTSADNALHVCLRSTTHFRALQVADTASSRQNFPVGISLAPVWCIH